MKQGIIISALGKETFSEHQIKKMEANLNVDFYTQKEPFKDNELVKRIKPYNIVAITRRSTKDIGINIIEQLNNLTGLAIFSTGYEWVDVKYLTQKGVKVSYIPEYSTTSVAEHTIALLLTAFRRIHLSYDYSRDLIDKSVSLRGYELQGKKIGIIGFGRIGQKVFSMLQAFDVNIKYYDIDEQKKQIDCSKYEDRDTLIETSDVILICASKERNAAYIIQQQEVHKMKMGVFIINAARADLVDNNAIINGVQSKKIFTYAVDDKVLLFRNTAIEKGRIIETAHTAWYSTEAMARGVDQWVENIIGLATGNYKNII